MTLTKKTSIFLTCTVFAFAILVSFFVRYLLATTFESYEDQEVDRNTARVMQSIDGLYDRLDSRDWSNWTDLYQYLRGEYDGFYEGNLDSGTMLSLGVNLLILADTNGQIVFSRMISLETGHVIERDDTFMPPHLVDHAGTIDDLSSFGYRGILSTSMGPMLIAARPVVRNDGSGIPSGTIVMGRFLDNDWSQKSVDATKVDFVIRDLLVSRLPDSTQQVVDELMASSEPTASHKVDDVVRHFSLLRNINGSPAVLLVVTTHRDIWAEGQKLGAIGSGAVLVAGLIFMFIVSSGLSFFVAKPLRLLTERVRQIAKTGEVPEALPISSNDELGLLARRFDELMRSQKEAEAKTRLLSSVIDRAARSMAFTDSEYRVEYGNSTFGEHLERLGFANEEYDLRDLLLAQGQTSEDFGEMMSAVNEGKTWSCDLVTKNEDGSVKEDTMLVSPTNLANESFTRLLLFYQDTTEKNAMGRQLQEAQRLEAVGQLAAGVAHEINTPIQYVGDNTRFMKESYEDVDELLKQLLELTDDDQQSIDANVVRAALKAMDAEYLREELPTAIDQSLDGITRVSNIVRAMKEFSHPAKEHSQVDVNRSIESTVTVASNEWKYVAEVELELDQELPLVSCNAGQLNQVILNMIVNGAHALADSDKVESGGLGKITIGTSFSDGWAEIRISDNGTGMPEDVKARIFEPFFTTKEVGKGTGQGLSIAYDVVVNKHNGTIAVESETGNGTSFIIRLPIEEPPDLAASAA